MQKIQSAVSICATLVVLLALGACSTDDASPAGDGSGSAAGAQSRPSAAAEPSANGQPRDVIAENLPYAEVNDELIYGYFAFPANMVEPLPAVLVVHDRWGLNDDVRASVERLAADGYIVLGVDLFAGQSAEDTSRARSLEIGVLEDRGRAQENIRQAIKFITDSSMPPSVSILGYGFGGGWALNAAIDQPDAFGAAISYYGQVPTEDAEINSLQVPFLGFFAESDRAVPIDSAREFSRKAEALRKDVEIRTFADVRRGFAETSAETFDAGASQAAWSHMLQFLDQRLTASATPTP